MDDTDDATLANVAPVYRLLEELGLRTTKTVWPVPCPEGSPNFAGAATLEDAGYLEFVRGLQARGFEIASHGATMESSRRERTVAGLERFREAFGHWPRVHANHSYNRENLYWGLDRLDAPPVKAMYRLLHWRSAVPYEGHVEGSPYWWGDLAATRLDYVRNLSFAEVSLERINPTLPYHDPARPLVRWWFSAADAEDGGALARLLTPRALDRLEADAGVCIVATHLGKGFARNGSVVPAVERALRDVARRPGWFVPVGELLDFLRAGRSSDRLPAAEWRRMQWRWLRDLLFRQARYRAARQLARLRRR